MSTMNIYDMTDTWNASGTTFAGIKLNVTDTASASGSLLMDLQVGGASQLQVTKAARVNLGPAVEGLFWRRAAAYKMEFGWNNSPIFGIASAGQFHLNGSLYFTAALDLSLFRDAANTLAQRNGVNAQAFRVYNTFTDASNYERGFMRYSSNVLQIGHEGAGTGNNTRAVEIYAGTLQHKGPNGSGSVSLINSNTPTLILTQSTGRKIVFTPLYMDMEENPTAPTAPAANSVRIYAEDDGAGKTRLMALFATGAAQQIAIEP